MFFSASAHADDNFVYTNLGQGAQIGFGHVVNENFSVRVDVGHEGSAVYQHNFGGNSYDINPQSTTTFNTMVDWFPFSGSGFRVSGGLGYDSNPAISSTATTDASGNYHINGNTYSANTVGQLRATSSYRKVIPEIGIGWESAPANKPGWRLITGLNLSLQTSGKSTLAAAGAANNSALQQDVAAEQGRFASDFGSGRARLNLSLGVGYTF
jgi:hypothetical protein